MNSQIQDFSLSIASVGLFSGHSLDWFSHNLITSTVGVTLILLNGIKIYKNLFPKKSNKD
tara:strand:- start:230 stop:409 length:180 start_codon:yes stop_codon:yes gene_type:complete